MAVARNLYRFLRGEKYIWLAMCILPIVSVLVVYSASGSLAHMSRGGNTEFYLMKHSTVLLIGLMFTYICYRLHYMTFARFSGVLVYLSIFLLLLTLTHGVEINGARRWLMVPLLDITFQTSDLAKLSLILYLAAQLSLNRQCTKDFRSAFMPILFPVMVVCALIAPADLSTAAMLFITCFTMMFIGQVNLKLLASMAAIGVVIVLMLVFWGAYFPEFVRAETWGNRISGFLHGTGDNYQIDQAKIAIAEGGWTGLGPGNSIQRNFLPSPYADFIYAIIVEEYGLIGGFAVLGAFMFLFFRCIGLVTNSPKAFGAIVAIGLSISLTLQALLNMAVSVDLLPVTGLTLPLISMGGTSVLFACISIGIILSVSRHVEDNKNHGKLHKTEIAYENTD